MRQRGAGRIVNVSSILGRFALPGSGLYAASRFALEAASDALRLELAPFGVRVVLVEPGVIATPLYQRAAALPGDDQALGATAPAGRGGSGSPSRLLHRAAAAGWAVAGGQTTISGPVADQAARHGLPARLRDPGGELLQVRRSDPTTDLEVTRCRIHRSRDASRHRRGPAAAGRHRAPPGRPKPPNHDPGDRFLICNLFAPLTNAARRNHHADLASRQDILRTQLLVGAQATRDHQQAIGIAN
jgi:hypothetical protein